MFFSLDYFESQYGLTAGKRLLFIINSIVFYTIMLIAVNKLGINPINSLHKIHESVNTLLKIRTFDDVVSDTTIGVLDSTVSALSMYNTIFSLFLIIIPIMVIVQLIHITVRIVKVTKSKKRARVPEFYFSCENNKQIVRHFTMMLIFFCITVCLFLPFYTEPNHTFSSDNGLGIAEFLTIGAIESADVSASLYSFQNSMILSMLFSMLAIAFIYILSSCITMLLCLITSSLENSLKKDAIQSILLCIIMLIGGKHLCEYMTKPFFDEPIVLTLNVFSYIVIGAGVLGFILLLLPLGKKLDSKK